MNDASSGAFVTALEKEIVAFNGCTGASGRKEKKKIWMLRSKND